MKLKYFSPFSNYVNVWIISASTEGAVVSLTILDFELEDDYDFLRVKDGKVANASSAIKKPNSLVNAVLGSFD